MGWGDSTWPQPNTVPHRIPTVWPCRAGVASEPEYLSRKDVQHHLGISEKGVDRFIRDHALRSGSGRQVLVALDAYATCLVGLRRRSTRDTASVPARATDHSSFPPIEYRPGLDVIAALCFEQKAGEPADRRMHFLLQERGKAPPSTPEEMRRVTLSTNDYIRDEWAFTLVVRILEASTIGMSLDRATNAPSCAEGSDAVRHARTCLQWYHSTRGRVTGAGLKRLLRQAPREQRDALLEALAQSIGGAANRGVRAPRAYALCPLLDEATLATRLHRARPTLKRWRVSGEGPPFMRIGTLVRYSTTDVEDWLRREPGC